jgi:hypothetical protein
VFFGLLAVDALMQIRHAPRYGAGSFNVAQLRILDAVGPGRTSYELCELVNAYLFVTIACGVGTRVALPIAAAVYSWLYFGSQLDSYQHHYLVALLLWLACFVPWERPEGARADTPVKTWALRLILLQLGIMYLWAAISKMTPAWWDGSTLGRQIAGPLRSLIDATVGIRAASIGVVFLELTLAFTVWNPRMWWFASSAGLLFHGAILVSGLEIGLFAWLMIGLYVLLIPDRVWIWIAQRGFGPRAVAVPAAARAWIRGRGRWPLWLAGLATALVLGMASRFDHAVPLAIVLSIVLALRTFRALVRSRPTLAWLGAAHMLAFATWFAVDRATTVASDYYVFWGGSARRLGDTESAMRAYERLVQISPDNASGHYQLGRLLLSRDRADDGLAELHVAERLAPEQGRAFVAEAQWLAAHGGRDAALAKARDAARAEPSDPDARRLVEALSKP